MPDRLRGFTLIEVVVVVALLALVGGGVYVWQNNTVGQTKTVSQVNPSPTHTVPAVVSVTPTVASSPTVIAPLAGSMTLKTFADQYPQHYYAAIAPDGKKRVLWYSVDDNSKSAIFLSRDGTTGNIVEERGIGVEAFVDTTPASWTSDGNFLFINANGADALNTYVYRFDGKTFKNGRPFVSLSAIVGPNQLLQGVQWVSSTRLQFTQNTYIGASAGKSNENHIFDVTQETVIS